jgi:hypothetical protein
MSDEKTVNATEEQPRPTGTPNQPTGELTNEVLEQVSGGNSSNPNIFWDLVITSVKANPAPNPSLGDGTRP